MGWPKTIAGVTSWKGVKYDEFTFELKKCVDGVAAEKMVHEFMNSDGLTAEFCESALDLVFLAHNQKRPKPEIEMLQDLATALLREYRRRISEPEVFLADELLRRFKSSDSADAENGNGEARKRLAETRLELRRVFIEGLKPRLNPGGAGFFGNDSSSSVSREDDDDDDDDDDASLRSSGVAVSRNKFLTHLEKCKNRASDDAKRQRSIAGVAVDAGEEMVQEFVDPMDELEISKKSLMETAKRAEMLQEMFREEVM